MKYSELLNYCLSKNGAYIDHPFGPESDIIKVEGKIFAQLFVLKGVETATLNCERITGDFYRQLYGCEITEEEMDIMRTVAREAGVLYEAD